MQQKSQRCFGCLSAFPQPPKNKEGAGGVTGAEQQKRAEGASESSRYECPSCERHFCVDCDVFCHEVVHNCPGCTSGGGAGVAANGDADVVMNGNGHENGSMNGNGIAVA